VENSRPLGPLPADPSATGVSPAQRSVLREVAGAAAPVTLAALAQRTGLHENTLRGHLGALSRAGLVRPHRSTPHGRGRPALLWSAVPGGGAGATEYAGLATALARTVQRTSSRPAEDAAAAGRAWGRELAGDQAGDQAGEEGDAGARSRLLEVLTRLGFAPEAGGALPGTPPRAVAPASPVLRLTRCPLLDVARELPEVVCNVHRGLVEGVLQPGDDGSPKETGVRLLPFAEPGACVLTLDAAGAAADEESGR